MGNGDEQGLFSGVLAKELWADCCGTILQTGHTKLLVVHGMLPYARAR